MDFKKIMPNWQNKGNEPSDELKAKGFKVGNKPPANIHLDASLINICIKMNIDLFYIVVNIGNYQKKKKR